MAWDDAQHMCNACGRSFVSLGSLNYHMRSCRSGKRQLEGALSKVHQLWQEKVSRKRRRLNPQSGPQSTPAQAVATGQLVDTPMPMHDASISVSVSRVVIDVQAESNH